jgi:hypothetical protein
MISRIIDNDRHTLACGFEHDDERLWISPVMYARKFRDDGLLTVFSFILGWGWDENDSFSLLPHLTLKRKVFGSMVDQNVTFTWCGFAVVTHICTETTPGGWRVRSTIPHADLSDLDEDEDEEAPTELSDA